MDTHPDNPPEASDSSASPSDTAPVETPTEPGGQGPAAASEHRGPRRRRRRRRGPRPAPAEAPRLGSAVEGVEGGQGAGEAALGENAAGEDGARPTLKLRNFRRRRRRLLHPPGLRPGTGEQPAGSEDRGAGAETTPQEGAPASESEGAAQPDQPSRPPRRRRRRRGPRPEGTGAVAAAGDTAAPAGDRPHARNQFGRSRRPRREGEAAAPQGREARSGDRERRERGPRSGPGGERRDRRERGGDRGDRRGRGRPGGRGGPERKVERRLYSVDAVVDRGFEDVESEGETRRVHWTIVKRTVADQISRKPVSAGYVLQRDGTDTEFPSLGAARDAVNKTIVHPEKLTPSKSEIAALKGSSR